LYTTNLEVEKYILFGLPALGNKLAQTQYQLYKQVIPKEVNYKHT